MKKIFALLLMVVMSVTLLAGCGSDPVYDDLENFINVEMVEVNENHTKIAEAYATMQTLEDDETLAKHIEDVLPIVEESIEKIEKIAPATEEVTALKEIYSAMLEAYKAGFEMLLEGCYTQEDVAIEAGIEFMNTAAEALEIYNETVEEIAKEHGGEVEY